MTNTRTGIGVRDDAVTVGTARVRVQARSVATVIEVDGTIDWRNVDGILRGLHRFIALGSPLVLDLNAAVVTAPELVGGLENFDVECDVRDVPWLLSADDRSAIRQLLRAAADDADLPVVDSVTAALRLFAASIRSRRRFATEAAQTRLCG
jgi:anti-sigma B factor antagonist